MFRMLVSVLAALNCYFVHAQPDALEYAALGDSYASGDGAGSSRLLPRFDALCGRFSDAYPVQVANSSDINVRILRNLACGGAVTASVLKTQLPFATHSDVLTVQVGGNEIDFFTVLNECVYQWRTFSTCTTALAKARGQVQSQTFLNNFNGLVAQAVRSAKQTSMVMFLGYARFFNDTTPQCDGVTFSHTDPDSHLYRGLRRQLNEVVILLNNVIRASADTHGARYIDVDQLFEGHRFCEADTIEPDHDSSWFFDDTRIDESQGTAYSVQTVLFPNPFKDFLGLTRTFHPTTEGHKAIAKEIVRNVRLVRNSR